MTHVPPVVPAQAVGDHAVCGWGFTTAHLGEVFQGQLEDRDGRRQRCLVSLPCSELYSQATYVADGSGSVVVYPPDKVRARRAAEITLEHFHLRCGGGTLTIDSNIPEGKGVGSSTSDCISAARAVADAFEIDLDDATTAMLVVRAEHASDNTMFSHCVLFAQREGIVVEDFAAPFPVLDVIGVDADERTSVDTLAYPPATYCAKELQLFEALRGALRRAIRTADLPLLGKVATISATVNERFLPKPCFRELLSLADHAGALGVAVAHSGTVAGVLMDPGDILLEYKLDFIMTKLAELGLPQVARFRTRAQTRRRSHRVTPEFRGVGYIQAGIDSPDGSHHRRHLSAHESVSG
jgi:uncharacterized protein involved in propanediol utilization